MEIPPLHPTRRADIWWPVCHFQSKHPDDGIGCKRQFVDSAKTGVTSKPSTFRGVHERVNVRIIWTAMPFSCCKISRRRPCFLSVVWMLQTRSSLRGWRQSDWWQRERPCNAQLVERHTIDSLDGAQSYPLWECLWTARRQVSQGGTLRWLLVSLRGESIGGQSGRLGFRLYPTMRWTSPCDAMRVADVSNTVRL